MAPFVEDIEDTTDLSWVLGSVFLENYYVVFDMTPTIGNSIGTNQIGYGPINTRNVLGDNIYKSDSPQF